MKSFFSRRRTEFLKMSAEISSSRRRENSASLRVTRLRASNFCRKLGSSAARSRMSGRWVYFSSASFSLNSRSMSCSLTHSGCEPGAWGYVVFDDMRLASEIETESEWGDMQEL